MEVKSVVQDIDPVTKQIKVSIPAETVTQEISSAITDLAARANLKGFRPGKAPRAMVEKLHGPRVRLEVANRLISNSLSKLVKDHSIDMIGAPEIDVALLTTWPFWHSVLSLASIAHRIRRQVRPPEAGRVRSIPLL